VRYRLWNESEHRYATAEEMRYLRTNPDDGEVEKLSYQKFLRYEPKGLVYLLFKNKYLVWQSADDWVVEWGYWTSSEIAIYEGDIFADYPDMHLVFNSAYHSWDLVSNGEWKQPISSTDWDGCLGGVGTPSPVLGNIHNIGGR
jgi:hypothetical protein